jgi:chromosome segregation ATPase
VDELRQAAEQLSGQLSSVEAVRPRRRQAMKELSDQIDTLRQKLRAADEALAGLSATEAGQEAAESREEPRAFTRGRIQHFLGAARTAEPDALSRLEHRVTMNQEAVHRLQEGLDPDEEREQLTSRLAVVGADMTRWAEELQLEHTGTARSPSARVLSGLEQRASKLPGYRTRPSRLQLRAWMRARLPSSRIGPPPDERCMAAGGTDASKLV